MAIWQYDVIVIPRCAVHTVFGAVPAQISQEDLNTHSWWNTADRHGASEFGSLLPEMQSWTKAIKSWGTSEGHRIDLNFDGDNLRAAMCRVDLRESSLPFVNSIVQVARRNNYLFVNDDGVVLEPIVDVLMNDITKSSAFSFVRDPVGYLKALEKASASKSPQ